MVDEFPDPSVVNSLDFYSSAFRIKRLLRRRGWQDVVPMNGKPHGFMPKDHFEEWSNYQKRLKMYKDENGGYEFERYVAQIMCQFFCNPATFSNKVLDLEPGGDFDILAEGPGEALFHIETKTSSKKSFKSCKLEHIWNFMVRESRFTADMSIFLLDTNQKLEEKLIPAFEMLFAFAKRISENGKLKKEAEVDIKMWLETLTDITSIGVLRKRVKEGVYFIYYPVLIVAGGDNIKSSIKESLSLYYNTIKIMSPFSRLSRIETGQVFQELPNWNDLPTYVHKNLVAKKFSEFTSWEE